MSYDMLHEIQISFVVCSGNRAGSGIVLGSGRTSPDLHPWYSLRSLNRAEAIC